MKTKPPLSIIAIIALIMVAALCAANHWEIIKLIGPQNILEGAEADMTNTIRAGINPYANESLPQRANVYGPVYYSVAAILSPWLPEGLPGLRLLAAGALIGACLTLFSIACKAGTGKPAAAASALILYITTALTYSILARPDTTGLLLMLLTIRLAMNRGIGWQILAAVAAVAAFLTKPYFLFGAGAAGLWVLWERGIRAALIHAGILAATAAVTAAVITLTIPNYWTLCIGIHRTAETKDFEVLVSQSLYFAGQHLPLLITAIAAAVLACKKAKLPPLRSLWRSSPGGPLGWALICTAVAVIVLMGKLGWHRGAYLIYFVHLGTPFLVLAAALATHGKTKLQTSILLAQTAILSACLQPKPGPESNAAWNQIAAVKNQTFNGRTPRILASTMLAGTPYANGLELPDNGQAQYLYAHNTKAGTNIGHTRELTAALTAAIQSGTYDEIWCCRPYDWPYLPKDLIPQSYSPAGVLTVPAYYAHFNKPWKFGTGAFHLERWVRKPAGQPISVAPPPPSSPQH